MTLRRNSGLMLRRTARNFVFRRGALRRIWIALFIPAYPDHLREMLQRPKVMQLLGASLGNALEIGAGSGMYTAYLTEHATSVTCLDVHDSVPDWLAALSHERRSLSYVCGSLDRLPFGDGVFDTVLCTEVIEHVVDDEAAAKEIARVLRDGGRCVVSTPVPPAPVVDRHHVREGYTHSALGSLLGRAGLAEVAHRYCLLVGARLALRLWFWWYRQPLLRHVRLPLGVFWPFVLVDHLISTVHSIAPYDIIVLARKKAGTRSQ